VCVLREIGYTAAMAQQLDLDEDSSAIGQRALAALHSYELDYYVALQQ
jgi:hypothetical protein